ncbi:hypothetical protein WT72_22820 [Burkholderia pseudomultivorans]|uniref:Lipoprotein n=1 Tax=Burkholderia pseudomultivorans TaxID=1207504 RepID=A0A132EQZ2_9BURK|nr:hypothetical protein [Burkholderia pseudomultivorans]KWF56303.1 hypothetical protein WT57_32720 [Burkholderia pseudomultivorans]KWI51315.1 hypothetical protein WT72_22820 [Burkholderia pseudomultivorans]
MLKLIAAAGVATLLAGCVVGPDPGYGYGQPYYSDPGYAYGPSPVYGTVNIWGGGGGGRDWDRGHRDYRRWDRDRGDHGGWRGGRRDDWNDGGGRGHGDGGHRH